MAIPHLFYEETSGVSITHHFSPRALSGPFLAINIGHERELFMLRAHRKEVMFVSRRARCNTIEDMIMNRSAPSSSHFSHSFARS